jgi:DNA-binding GntR family transcriptional regulator
MEEAHKYLYEAILSGDIGLGSPIYEAEVAGRLKISRSPVREALKRLEAEGLVVSYPGRGSFVIQISQHDLEEIFEIRRIFEVASLAKAFHNISPTFWEEIEAAVSALGANSSSGDFYKVDHRLHYTIIGCNGNNRLKQFYHRLETQIDMVRRISAQWPTHFSNSKNFHLKIIRAMRQGDLAEAERQMGDHIDDVRSNTIQVFVYGNGLRPDLAEAPEFRAGAF